MPILKNAKKALRASQRKAEYNRRAKSRVKTALDSFTAQPGTDTLATAFSAIDKAVRRNLFHRNKAARYKARLSKQLPAAK